MAAQRKDGCKRLRVVYLLLAAVALSTGGCLLVAAGAAGAGAATYVYIRGKVCQEYAAGFGDTWAAVQKSLQELALPLEANENNGKTGKVTSRTADGSAITIDLEVLTSRIPAEGTLTRVCVRVGLVGDQALSERILGQINSHLAPPGAAPAPVPTAGAPAWTPPAGPIRPVAAVGPPETPPPPVAGALPDKPVPLPK